MSRASHVWVSLTIHIKDGLTCVLLAFRAPPGTPERPWPLTNRQCDRRRTITSRSPGSCHDVLSSGLTALGTSGAYAIAGDLRICPRKTVLVYNAALRRFAGQLG